MFGLQVKDSYRRAAWRTRHALATARARSGSIAQSVGGWIASERQEIGILLGTLMLAAGVALVVDVYLGSRPVTYGTALMLMGSVWLWIHLPARDPFIVRPPAPEKGRRET